MVHHIKIPLDPNLSCAILIYLIVAAFLCSTLLILSMTFDRFYSIIRPHKAASFNTVKRTKITIVCIIIFSSLFNIPHLFISSHEDFWCITYGAAMRKPIWVFHYWFSFIVGYALPFVLLLVMNTVIIYTIHKSSKFRITGDAPVIDEGQHQSQTPKMKKSDKQVYTILLLVAFGF